MTKTLLTLAVAAGALALSQGASVAAPSMNPGLSAPAATAVAWRHDWRRHHRYWHAYDRWNGRYPTANSFRRHGRCVEDLGYGRVELCD